LETARVENEGLEGDLSSLERRVETMQQSLMEIEDDSMAEIQAVAEGEETVPAMDESAETLDEETSEEAALAALDELTGEEAAEEAVETVTEEEVVEGEEVFVDETAELEELAVTEEEIDVTELAPETTAPPKKEVGLLASLLGNPLVAGGAALLVLVLLAVGYILVKRRRDSLADEAEATLAADLEQGFDTGIEDVADSVEDAGLEDFAAEAEAVEEPAAIEEPAEEEESFDSESTMILPEAAHEDTVVTQAAGEAEEYEEEERDDVIAEADVYLAYGIYQQAEELLQNAINDNPDKDSYRVKLAETYFAGKNADGMAKLGTEMKERLGSEETPAWKKVAAMGKELCPDADVFQQAGEVADLDIDELMPKSPEPMDFDLGDDSGGDSGEDVSDLDLDFGAADDSAADLDLSGELADGDFPVDETVAIPEGMSEEVADADELEFDIGEAEAIEPEAEEEFSLDIEASELDIEDEPAPEPVEEDSVEIDSSELDFDMGLEEEPAEAAEVPAAADTSSEVDLSDLGDAEEVNTKLDLAKAYIDMGDHEGARDILDEVVAGGNDEQKKQAQELLSQID
jgi:pilus assembly protein FimV